MQGIWPRIHTPSTKQWKWSMEVVWILSRRFSLGFCKRNKTKLFSYQIAKIRYLFAQICAFYVWWKYHQWNICSKFFIISFGNMNILLVLFSVVKLCPRTWAKQLCSLSFHLFSSSTLDVKQLWTNLVWIGEHMMFFPWGIIKCADHSCSFKFSQPFCSKMIYTICEIYVPNNMYAPASTNYREKYM